MPSIKLKKKTAEYLAEKERESEKTKALETTSSPVPESTKAIISPEKKAKKLMSSLGSEIILEKRKRTIPSSEQKAIDWVEENIEKHEDSHLVMNRVYELFTEFCQEEGDTSVADIGVIERVIHQKYGKNFSMKEASPYSSKIKLVKTGATKAKAQTFVNTAGESKSMRDIIIEAIDGCGNTSKGVLFRHLKNYIMSHYPAVRIDLHPNKLVTALERGLYYGHVELSKGVGRCGFYRLPGAPVVEDEKEKKKKRKKTESSEEDEEGKEGESAEPEDGSEEKENGEPPKKKKKSKKESEGDTEESAGDETQEKKKRKKKKKKKLSQKWYEDSAYKTSTEHCEPKSIEQVFPLAITYGCEPKETSVREMKNYIGKYYDSCDEDKLKKSLDHGEEGHIFQATGGKSYRLLVNEFNPEPSDDYEDRVCQAIIACCQPKIASAVSIKGYIQEYHPNFNIESRPKKFKNALIKAANKNIIRQVSGLGATGSFLLVDKFVPSPYVLAGQEDMYQPPVASYQTMDKEEKFYEELYVPRATKSGRTGKIKESWDFHTAEKAKAIRKAPKNRANRTATASKPKSGRKERVVYKEEDDDEDVVEKPKGRKSLKKAVNYNDDVDDDVDDVDDDEEDIKPKGRKSGKSTKAKKRGRPSSPKKATKSLKVSVTKIEEMNRPKPLGRSSRRSR